MLRRSTARYTSAAAAAVYDMRSDTITKPTDKMREYMAKCFDRQGKLVRELEEEAAAVVGKTDAVYVTSGSMSNLLAIMAHAAGTSQPECVVGASTHIAQWEAGSAASVGGVYVRQLPVESSGQIALPVLAANIAGDRMGDGHRAATTSVALENTNGDCGGRVLPMSYVDAVKGLCSSQNVALHCDGARLWNAAASLGHSVSALTKPFDSCSLCLSKGLGAPAGSVLVSDDAEFCERARKIMRDTLGGGAVGDGAVGDDDGTGTGTAILAAAGLFALRNNAQRVGEDNVNAAELASLLRSRYMVHPTESNIVVCEVGAGKAGAFVEAAQKRGVCVQEFSDASIRAVLNLHILGKDITKIADLMLNLEY